MFLSLKRVSYIRTNSTRLLLMFKQYATIPEKPILPTFHTGNPWEQFCSNIPPQKRLKSKKKKKGQNNNRSSTGKWLESHRKAKQAENNDHIQQNDAHMIRTMAGYVFPNVSIPLVYLGKAVKVDKVEK